MPTFWKPERRAKLKARKARVETKVKRAIRAKCVRRDGYCRLYSAPTIVQAVFGQCEGPAEWAHLEDKKRARTRGMPPEVRHTTEGTCMFCRRHHRMYDAGQIVLALPVNGANGLMDYKAPGENGRVVWKETNPL
jgi:hypothetical protein